MRIIVWGLRLQDLVWMHLRGNVGGLFGGQRSGALTLFAARGDGVHVPQRLHEGGVNLELPAGRRQVLAAARR